LHIISALFMWVESIVGPSTEIFICWWFEQSEKRSSLIANLWPYHFTENLWVHFMHNGESLGGDCTLSYRVRKHSYLTTFVSPCFPHGCQSKQLVAMLIEQAVKCPSCKCENMGKICAGFLSKYCAATALSHFMLLWHRYNPKVSFFCT
jgi:hypothetical protein